MFDFEPEITSPESPPVIQPTHPSIFGLDFDESRINLIKEYPKLPTKSSPDLGNFLKDFESESKNQLEKAMTISRSSANPTASNSS